MSDSGTSFSRDQLLVRFNDMRPLLLELAKEGIGREIQSKVGASDIVQQTLIEAYQHVHTIELEDDRHIFNWLSKILLYNLKDVSRSFRLVKKRSVQREQHMPSEANLEDRKGFGQSLESQEDLALLCSAMTCLPHAHQKVLRWRYHEQLTFPEIAELVGRTEDAVRMQVKRAIRRLAQEMHIHDNSTSR